MDDIVTISPGLEEMIADLANVSTALWDKGWAERNAGNASANVTSFMPLTIPRSKLADVPRTAAPLVCPEMAGQYILVTGTGRRFRDFARKPAVNSCILRVTEDGTACQLVWGGDGDPGFRPTSEFPSHMMIHQLLWTGKDPARVVLHTHPTELIALTHIPEYTEEKALNRALWAIHPEVKIAVPTGVGLVPYTLPSSVELAKLTVASLAAKHRVIIWEKHGVLAVAPDASTALDLIEVTNKAAEIIIMCKSAGTNPTGLTKAQIDEVVKAFKLKE